MTIFTSLGGYHMDEKLYELMDWAGVEAIVYSEEDQPQNLLGAHVTEDGITIQGFFPGCRFFPAFVHNNG